MGDKVFTLFSQSKQFELQIDDFLDKVLEAGLVFEEGVRGYLEKGFGPHCEGRLDSLTRLKSGSTQLRRHIETALYTEMLIPDYRGDVLILLDSLDDLADLLKANYALITLSKPSLPDQLEDDFHALVDAVVKSVESAVLGGRAFFRDIAVVRDHVTKINFYESEADDASYRLKKQIFQLDLDLAHQLHLSNTVELIDQVADKAEDVGDHLSIFSLKRAF